jgi:23S rRNA (adenine2503-C2)-methyltransferase
MDKQDIKDFTLKELEEAITGIDEPLYRAKQIFFWLYRKDAHSFREMNNLPDKLIDKLNRYYRIGSLDLRKQLESKDGTEKFLFKLSDGNFIETVLIHTQNRKTACLSTQVGCKFACSFCASGRMGFVRNLTPSEIVNQILFLEHELKHKITNYVLMGMGEPLDNYENTAKALFIMNNPGGLSAGARRITISTCGVIPGIDKLKDLGLQVNLSISLHATNNKLRDELVPINKRYPLEKLIEACERYIEKTGRAITLEYVLIKNKNHSLQDADRLAAIAKRLKAKVNLIACSGVPPLDFDSPCSKDINLFINNLVERKVNVILRKSKGADIQAACGQLAGKKNVKI